MDSISTSEFVAIFSDPKQGTDKYLKQLRDSVQISPLQSAPGTYLVTLPVPAPDAKSGWNQLNELFAGKAAIYPVYRDQDDVLHYSVGKMQMRFPEPPSPKELQQLCRKQGLKAAERNEYAPAQISFQLRDPQAQFLPEFLTQLQEDTGKNVKIWPETLTEFQRGV